MLKLSQFLFSHKLAKNILKIKPADNNTLNNFPWQLPLGFGQGKTHLKRSIRCKKAGSFLMQVKKKQLHFSVKQEHTTFVIKLLGIYRYTYGN